MDVRLRQVYLLSTEENGDFIFMPAGVVIALDNGKFSVYCVSANHNKFRAALSRHSWTELEQGVTFRDTHFRLDSILDDITKKKWTTATSTPQILKYLYESNPRHLYFLQTHVAN